MEREIYYSSMWGTHDRSQKGMLYIDSKDKCQVKLFQPSTASIISHSSYRLMKDLLCLKEIIDKDNTPQNNVFHWLSSSSNICCQVSPGESSWTVARISHQHLGILSWVLALVSLQGESQMSARRPCTQQGKAADNNPCLGYNTFLKLSARILKSCSAEDTV